MKKLIVLLIPLLSSCALVDSYLMKYDTNEYKIVTEIRADAQEYKETCANQLLSQTNAIALANKTNLFVLYSQYQPHNDPVIKASIELNKIAQGLKTQYDSSNKVSPMFCKIKFESVEHNAETIQKTVGAKPK